MFVQGYAQLVLEIFSDCLDDPDAGNGELNDVPVCEFAIYLFILSIFRSHEMLIHRARLKFNPVFVCAMALSLAGRKLE